MKVPEKWRMDEQRNSAYSSCQQKIFFKDRKMVRTAKSVRRSSQNAAAPNSSGALWYEPHGEPNLMTNSSEIGQHWNSKSAKHIQKSLAPRPVSNMVSVEIPLKVNF